MSCGSNVAVTDAVATAIGDNTFAVTMTDTFVVENAFSGVLGSAFTAVA